MHLASMCAIDDAIDLEWRGAEEGAKRGMESSSSSSFSFSPRLRSEEEEVGEASVLFPSDSDKLSIRAFPEDAGGVRELLRC